MGVKVREKVKGSGEWCLFISHNGKRKSKRVGRDQKKAIEAAKKIEATRVLGDLDIEKEATKTPIFEEYATIWLDTYIKPLLFLDTCRKISPDFYPLFLCGFRTGMRIGEILALEWGDIDWAGMYIIVQRSIRREKLNMTKTEKVRRVDMSNQLAETLKHLLTTRKLEALQKGCNEVTGAVFTRDGDRIPKNLAGNHYNKVLQKAGIRKVRIHDMRHTYASILLSNNESLVYVKEQLGHSSIKMTVDIYGHLIPSSNRAAVNRLDDQTPFCTPAVPCKNEKAVTL